jgi:hypothetical protein
MEERAFQEENMVVLVIIEHVFLNAQKQLNGSTIEEV